MNAPADEKKGQEGRHADDQAGGEMSLAEA